MFNSFLSQFFIIFLLIICSIRIFFTKKSKIDAAAVLAPAALIISILHIFVWNASQLAIILVLLSFIVFLTNGRSLLRLSENLFIDRYSDLFIIATVIEFLAVLFTLGLLLFNKPVNLKPSKFDSTKTVQRIAGNCTTGFETVDNTRLDRKISGYLYTYTPDYTKGNPEGVILFAGNNKAEVQDYEPYFLFLSKKGYTVVAADFYSKDISWYEGIKNLKYFRKFHAKVTASKPVTEKQAELFRANTINSYKALTSLARKNYGEEVKIYYITDQIDYDAVYEISESAGSGYLGFYSLNRIAEYKTSGHGFAEQTDISEARKAGLKRDKTLFIPRYASGKTVSELSMLLEGEKKELPPQPQETETEQEAVTDEEPAAEAEVQ